MTRDQTERARLIISRQAAADYSNTGMNLAIEACDLLRELLDGPADASCDDDTLLEGLRQYAVHRPARSDG